MRRLSPFSRLCAVTLLELIVVVMIISILATIATGIYSGETQRARVAATRELIHSLEVAITRYEIDTGSLPPGGSGTEIPPNPSPAKDASMRLNGSGYLHLALMHSLSGNATSPAAATWKGPYINVQNDQVALRAETSTDEAKGMTDFVDSWGTPLLYVAWPEYSMTGMQFWGGTQMFYQEAPEGSNPDLPAPNPYAITESYYNPRTFQLVSYGPDATTQKLISGGGVISNINYAGTQADDINNFGY